jgi:dipeptidase
MIDLSFQDRGSVWIMRAKTKAGHAWISEKVEVPSYMRIGNGIAIDHRMVGDIMAGALEEGLSIGE